MSRRPTRVIRTDILKGEWYDMQVEQENITVRGKPTIELAVKSTRHGPVIYKDRIAIGHSR